jgi:mRNA-degrading endonuclease RelE of RelBE toxin-antitoxin system
MPYSIHYHPQVEAALSSLGPTEQSRVRASIRRLAESGLSNTDVARLKDIIGNEPVYALRVGNDLRVLFTASPDSITVLDVLNRRFAERYG